MNIKSIFYCLMPLFINCLSGCSTVTIDQVKFSNSDLQEGDSVVVLGRRSSGDYETEPELISCVGKSLGSGSDAINVIPEQEFVDRLYPWFESRTAPKSIRDLQRLLNYDKVHQIFDDYNIHYIVWIDGITETTKSHGSISCGMSATVVSCFGFGSWDERAKYEASIWDYRTNKNIGKISSQADGTSYVPAIVIPVPLLAAVQSNACSAMADQLKTFF